MTTSPPVWDDANLTTERLKATQLFRDERTTEPLDHYVEFYESAFQTFAEILEETEDLRQVRELADTILTVRDRQNLARYLASPPFSKDDLQTLADVSLAVGSLKKSPENVELVMDYILMALDPRRFPWVRENRIPTAAEKETAMVSTAAMFAMRKMETWRRGRGRALERSLKEFLSSLGLIEVSPVPIANSSHGPAIGQFCGETSVMGGKADVVVRLHDGRLLPLECKVSNSETNSYKRLIHDCGEKAQTWVAKLGPANCSPAAVLSGCYSLGNLKKAQDMGLMLIWSHDFAPLGEFIEATRP